MALPTPPTLPASLPPFLPSPLLPPPPIDCTRHPIDPVHEKYLTIYRRVKLLARVLDRYMLYSPKDWHNMSSIEKTEMSKRISSFVSDIQKDLKKIKKKHREHDHLRKMLRCTLDNVNLQLGTLTHLIRGNYFLPTRL